VLRPAVPPREETERQCALTREVRPAGELIRFAVSPEGELVPDTDARAEGRGVWITLGAAKVAEAQRKKAFARSLKANVRVPDDLAVLTRQRLAERLLGALQMARKAGQLVTGATRVRAAIDSGETVALLTASDAAEDGRQKLLGALRSHERTMREAGQDMPETPHFELLDSGQLGLALGVENVIHAALTKGGAAQAAVKRAERLARYDAN
jgi:predicted RNA-binding protein YlxR (DUF448 family)